jgi:GNAT superfamily N-acetyltransferase
MAVDGTPVLVAVGPGQNPAYGRPVCLTAARPGRYPRIMTIEVRPAVRSDAHEIAGVHVRAWQEAYAHLAPVENLARLSVERHELRWNEILPLPEAVIWVAVDDGELVGFAGSSPSRDVDAPRPLELQSIYVLASHHGTGAGQRLLDAVLGSAPAYLWVADDNPRARAFYARNGFIPDGVTKVGPVAGTDILEARLVR